MFSYPLSLLAVNYGDGTSVSHDTTVYNQIELPIKSPLHIGI